MSTELDVYLTCVLVSMLVMSEEKKKIPSCLKKTIKTSS